MVETKKERFMAPDKNISKGFALVELAMVVVIIGLLTVGVLKGQSLIVSARVVSTLSQLRDYDSIASAFRSKYNELPGDMSRAVDFELGDNGNGDGFIRDTNDGTWANGSYYSVFDHEVRQFWVHLSRSKMVAETYEGNGAVIETDFPSSKLNKGGIVAFNGKDSNSNLYAVGVASGGVAYTDGLTPDEAFTIDSKLDDSNPGTGNVTAHATAVTDVGDNTIADDGNCVQSGQYNLAEDTNHCGLHVRSGG